MNIAIRFRPKLLDTLTNYSGQDFAADLIAGLTVGIVALPLAMAFAIASGVPPQAGIFTPVIAGFLIPRWVALKFASADRRVHSS